MVTVHAPVPVQPSPVQPVKVESAAAAAVRVTTVPSANECVQVAPQSMPAGALVTPPVPVPDLLTVNRRPLIRLPDSMKTAESKPLSLASAIASFMWFVTPALTFALQVRTVVRPSICESIEPGAGRTLSRNRSAWCGVVSPPGSPLLIVLTETASVVPGTSAQFVPSTKNAKTSLKSLLAKSLYSSEEKT